MLTSGAPPARPGLARAGPTKWAGNPPDPEAAAAMSNEVRDYAQQIDHLRDLIVLAALEHTLEANSCSCVERTKVKLALAHPSAETEAVLEELHELINETLAAGVAELLNAILFPA